MSASYQYLIKKYIDYNLLDKDGNKTINNKNVWDPFIYPDNGYIPQCSICKNVYDNYIKQHENGEKISELLWPHLKCSCLWKDFFEDKIKKTTPGIKLKDR